MDQPDGGYALLDAGDRPAPRALRRRRPRSAGAGRREARRSTAAPVALEAPAPATNATPGVASGRWVPAGALPERWTVVSTACRWSSVPTPAGQVGLFPEHARRRALGGRRGGGGRRPLAAGPRRCSTSSPTRASRASPSPEPEPGSSTSTPRDPRSPGRAGTPPWPASPIARSAGSWRTRRGSWPARRGAVGATTASSWTRRRTATGRVGERGASPRTSSRSSRRSAPLLAPGAVVRRLHRPRHGAAAGRPRGHRRRGARPGRPGRPRVLDLALDAASGARLAAGWAALATSAAGRGARMTRAAARRRRRSPARRTRVSGPRSRSASGAAATSPGGCSWTARARSCAPSRPAWPSARRSSSTGARVAGGGGRRGAAGGGSASRWWPWPAPRGRGSPTGSAAARSSRSSTRRRPTSPASRRSWPPARDPLLIVVEDAEKPGNLGAIARSADGAGATALLVAVHEGPRGGPLEPERGAGEPGHGAQPADRDRPDAARSWPWLRERAIRVVAARVQAATDYREADLRGPRRHRRRQRGGWPRPGLARRRRRGRPPADAGPGRLAERVRRRRRPALRGPSPARRRRSRGP